MNASGLFENIILVGSKSFALILIVNYLVYEIKLLNHKYKYANNLGRYLGFKYPDGDCDEMVQRYISKK